MDKFKEMLIMYCKKEKGFYNMGVLQIHLNGDVWLNPEYKNDHFVGRISTFDELSSVCKIWNKKKIEDYKI